MTTVTITDSGRIRNEDGMRIGEVLADGNTIKKIEIDPPYQNQGFGKESIREFAHQQRENGFDEMFVACITNKYLTRILEDFGGEEISSHRLPIAPHPMLERDKPDYRLSLPIEE